MQGYVALFSEISLQIGLDMIFCHKQHKKKLEGFQMKKYVCSICGYIYDPEKGDPDNGIAPGTKFEDLPDDWVCPLCGAGKDEFEPEI